MILSQEFGVIGSTAVSKTSSEGSSPSTPAIIKGGNNVKRILALLLALLMCCVFLAPTLSEDLEIITIDPIEEEEVEILEEFELSLDEDVQTPFLTIELSDLELEVEELNTLANNETLSIQKEYDYVMHLSNSKGYSIVALNDAFIDMHIRGSLWIGGTLTSNNGCGTDDGSINHQPSGTESYIYNNESEMYFQGRTENQSKDAYRKLSAAAVESTKDYWTNIINSLPNDGEQWIYVEPDENGYVNLEKWDYQTQGSDESQESIKKVYWTNASKVDMGGLAGHLIAPFADINITWCNHGGTIVGWNITTHGEAHINYWEPKITEPVPTVTATPAPGKIILQKTLVNDVWHIRCDVMDGTTFQAGGGIWKTDVIMNPTKKTSKEGHRSNKCGDADHWIIWLDNTGTPFRMDEIKSGATGGTLPTMIFEEVYSPQDLGFSGWGELEPEMTDKVELYKENFKIQKDITTVKPGERIYWVTWNGNQRWYHSGIPYVAPPTFTFYIDGEPYPIVAGQYLELEDVLPGAHEIKEDVSLNDYIITIFGSSEVEGTKSIVNIIDGETIEVEYVNEIITPPTAQPSTPPPLPTTVPTVTIKPTETPTPTPTTTIKPTATPTPTVTIKPTITPTPTKTPTPTIQPTFSPTPEITATPTAIPTEEPTHEPTKVPTATPTSSPTPTPTTEPSPTPTITITPTNGPTTIPTVQPTDTPVVTVTPGKPSESPRPTSTPTETIKPTAKPTETPVPATATPTVSPTSAPSATRTATPTAIPTATPTLIPSKAPTLEPIKIPETITPKPTELPEFDVEIEEGPPTPKIPELSLTIEPTASPTPRPTLSPEIIQEIIDNLPDVPILNPKPDFSQFTDEELEKLFDIWGYETPLYGGLLQTGDEMPIWVLYAGGIGSLSALIAILLKKKKP